MDYFEYLKSLTPVYEPEIAAKEYTGADGEFPVIMHGQRINCKYKTFTQDSIAYMALMILQESAAKSVMTLIQTFFPFPDTALFRSDRAKVR